MNDPQRKQTLETALFFAAVALTVAATLWVLVWLAQPGNSARWIIGAIGLCGLVFWAALRISLGWLIGLLLFKR